MTSLCSYQFDDDVDIRYGVHSASAWEVEATRLVVGASGARPHTLYPLPSAEVLKAPMLLNAPVLNQLIQQNVAAVMPVAGQPLYQPLKKNRVGDGVHQAISDGVQSWLSGIVKQVSKLCKHRLTAVSESAHRSTHLNVADSPPPHPLVRRRAALCCWDGSLKTPLSLSLYFSLFFFPSFS